MHHHRADLRRVTNLLSNGIRFTSTSCQSPKHSLNREPLLISLAVRRIEVRFDLSLEPPAEACLVPRLPEPPVDGYMKVEVWTFDRLA